ncbi:hypothetical protein PI124_g13189 [Phytophthora idaei]|nr:hypothetical protein PI125_g13280 [Phytophthora idaei]KAG3149870.1 hypothetical protein PI126_g11796 [Phytophthora idaei]KAG3241961.1 hypothetical protein PI124_g13189 [Phytophthora idaei]
MNGKESEEGESEQKDGLIDFVKHWQEASTSGHQLAIGPVEWIETLQQPDAVSCGVLVVAQVNSYLTEGMQLQEYNVLKRDVSVMRPNVLDGSVSFTGAFHIGV